MKLVKITGTTYGYHRDGKLEPKDRKSPPIYLDDAEAERLVSLGYAEIVLEEVATVGISDNNVVPSDDTLENKVPIGADFKSEVTLPNYPAMSMNGLRRLAKEHGMKIPVGATKAEIIDRLDDYYGVKPMALSAEDIVT